MASESLIEEFSESVLIIDDRRDEVEGLIAQLESCDVNVEYRTPDEFESKTFKRVRRIVFVDLKLDDSKSITDNIATIRKLFKEKFPLSQRGVYGVVLWTKHADDILEFREKISNDRRACKYNTPLFIVGLDKSKYISHGYGDCLSDLDNVLRNDKAAYFFINWSISVQKATGVALSDVYSFVADYTKQDSELQYLLFLLAKNYTGVPGKILEENPNYDLATDACKALDELLYADLINKLNLGGATFFDYANLVNPWADDFQMALKIYAKLNAKAFIDIANIDQALVVPGNVYEINGAEIPTECSFPKKSRKIMIELTPPCDFSHKKTFSRCVCGFMIECSTNAEKQKIRDKNFKSDYRYVLWPIDFEGKTYMMCFDFRCLLSLQDAEISSGAMCTILFKANPKLFADILQKFSSHAARLGVPTIIPDMPEINGRKDHEKA